MGSTIYIAASGAEARLRQLEMVANNLANLHTDGFKADRTSFESFFEGALGGDEKTAGAAGGVYVSTGETGFDASSGPIRRTDKALDVAIEGDGYFVVETDRGDRYTRAGSFRVDPDGQLVTPSGDPVLGSDGPLEISGPGARILGNGDVVDRFGAVVGTLRVVAFDDEGVLAKQGDGLFVPRNGERPDDVDRPALIEGSVEASNVQPTAEMANLVVLQRAFEASLQAMKRDDEATERLIQEISQ